MRNYAKQVFAIAILGFCTSSLGAAQAPIQTQEMQPNQNYPGVSSGSGHQPIRPRHAQSARVEVTWPGFEMRPDGVSRFFLQLTRAAEFAVRRNGRVIEIQLKGASIAVHNNEHPLDTSFFNTPVKAARVARRGRDVVFILELRNETGPEPIVTLGQGASGPVYLNVDFPAGNWRR